jgi:hypothetical protein
MIEIHDLKKIRTFYPSQWEGRTATGETVYIRYKHGELSASLHDANEASLILFCEPVGEKHGFDMDTKEMKTHLTEVCCFLDGEDDHGLTGPEPNVSNE